MTAPTDPDARPGSDRIVLVVAVLASFVAFLDGTVVNLALPAIAADLGGGLALQQWVVDGYLLTLGALILVAGAVSDQFGRLRVLRAGLALFGVASLLCAFAPTGWALVAARLVQGVGAAFLVPSSLALVNAHFVGPARAAAIAGWTAWTGTSFLVGPPLGGVLVDALSWRWVFAVNAVPVVLTYVLSTRLAADVGRTARIDVTGATLAALGTGGTVLALIEGPRRGPDDPVVLVAAVVGVAALAAFPIARRYSREPMLPRGLFASRTFAVGNLVTAFQYAAISLGLLLLALYLQEVAGFSAAAAGLVTMPIPVLSLLLARTFGALANRRGPRWFLTVGPLLCAAGFACLSGVDGVARIWSRMPVGLCLLGLGLAVTASPLTAAVLSAVDPARSGIASAVNNAVSRLAGLMAVAFTGLVVGGAGAEALDGNGFRRGAWVVAGLFAVAGAVAAVGLRDTGPGRPVEPATLAGCRDRAGPPPG